MSNEPCNELFFESGYIRDAKGFILDPDGNKISHQDCLEIVAEYHNVDVETFKAFLLKNARANREYLQG